METHHDGHLDDAVMDVMTMVSHLVKLSALHHYAWRSGDDQLIEMVKNNPNAPGWVDLVCGDGDLQKIAKRKENMVGRYKQFPMCGFRLGGEELAHFMVSKYFGRWRIVEAFSRGGPDWEVEVDHFNENVPIASILRTRIYDSDYIFGEDGLYIQSLHVKGAIPGATPTVRNPCLPPVDCLTQFVMSMEDEIYRLYPNL